MSMVMKIKMKTSPIRTSARTSVGNTAATWGKHGGTWNVPWWARGTNPPKPGVLHVPNILYDPFFWIYTGNSRIEFDLSQKTGCLFTAFHPDIHRFCARHLGSLALPVHSRASSSKRRSPRPCRYHGCTNGRNTSPIWAMVFHGYKNKTQS